MADEPKSDAPPPPAASWFHRFGHRNIAYILFVVLLIPLGIAMEASGSRGPDAGGGITFALIL